MLGCCFWLLRKSLTSRSIRVSWKRRFSSATEPQTMDDIIRCSKEIETAIFGREWSSHQHGDGLDAFTKASFHSFSSFVQYRYSLKAIYQKVDDVRSVTLTGLRKPMYRVVLIGVVLMIHNKRTSAGNYDMDDLWRVEKSHFRAVFPEFKSGLIIRDEDWWWLILLESCEDRIKYFWMLIMSRFIVLARHGSLVCCWTNPAFDICYRYRSGFKKILCRFYCFMQRYNIKILDIDDLRSVNRPWWWYWRQISVVGHYANSQINKKPALLYWFERWYY